ncbi:cupin domain-containing protein [Alkalilimnicola sp. S0819]|uniref:cupin domain-containing protein n=1 Tax=Alkalilimnicola sp. S0819 TaxID=2613922 RepID=UPI001262084A|nr:cupin domain-containing protein [Alkalilimnicola sp. S0819]KAB7624304.1 cupin domain-containing protein [Alkalilimnicola sp. S0819]MPQ16128.1 cupin domain-containing protein [Alkalilimnicola sp. S0819]
MQSGNLLANLPAHLPEELFEPLLQGEGLRIERIVSTGQATPEGQWYEQEDNEWVLLLQGAAGVLFDGEPAPRELAPGDWLRIPAGCRHRVAWTSAEQASVWLAVHYR